MSENKTVKICPRLKKLLEHEIKAGNSIKAIETGWSKMKLVVRLTNPLDMEYLRRAADKDPDLEIWQSRDIKNPDEAGIVCKSAKQSLSGPAV